MTKLINKLQYGAVVESRPRKGKMEWQYSPLKNYRLSEDKYKYLGKLYTKSEILKAIESELNFKEDASDEEKDSLENITLNKKIESKEIEKLPKFTLIDFDTPDLGFNLENPVNILPLYSYDGTVNLILNDGKNIPRLINTRFSTTGQNTYEIVDRKGDDDTNIYDSGELFDIDTSLYKRVNTIPKIEFKGTLDGGNLKVGNYYFYFKLADADGNESDFIGLSGLVSLFIGTTDPHSMYTGTKNQNCHKIVKFIISDIDKAYTHVNVYYSRFSAEGVENIAPEYMKIDKKFIVTKGGKSIIQVTGYENTIGITLNDLNQSYNIIDSAKTQALNGNRLFLGNVHKAEIDYLELRDLSLRFFPKLLLKDYELQLSENYTVSSSYKGYYDVQNIYNEVGYWPEEYYRLGVVYILKSGELSPVFNIRGGLDLNTESTYSNISLRKNGERNYILSDESTYILNNENLDRTELKGNVIFENSKGVISFDVGEDLTKIIGIKIEVLDGVIEEIRKHARGLFFVRQKRIPTILALGLTIGIEKESHTPVIPVKGGILDPIIADRTLAHLAYSGNEAEAADVNYITEGFLTRYKFRFKKKSSSFWKKVGGALLIGTAVAALAVATVFTGGAAGAIAAGATISASVSAGAAAVAGVAASVGAVLGAGAALGATLIASTGVVAAGVLATMGAIDSVGLAIRQHKAVKIYNGWETVIPSGYMLEELEESRKVGGKFLDRVIIKNPELVEDTGIICPEFSLNQPYFNSIFTGNNHIIKEIAYQPTYDYLQNRRTRHFYNTEYTKLKEVPYESKIVGVPDNTKLIGLEDQMFRSRAGDAEEAYKFEEVGNEYQSAETLRTGENDDETINNLKINSDIVRGCFGPYLASSNELGRNRLVNIYIPGYSESAKDKYLAIRAEDTSPFYAISDRISLLKDDAEYINSKPLNSIFDNFVLYRGDSYICQYTQRIIRNFNDPAAPLNDKIVDENTWKNHYNPDDKTSYSQINLGDVNAVLLGIWITFRLRSSYNLNIRTIDDSYVDEKAMSGHGRGYYPVFPLSTEGVYKHSESNVYNKGFSVSVGSLIHFEEPDVPAEKNWFGTRIMYSDIHINDAFKNGYRVFRPTNYRDYTREYGSITKLISVGNSLLCVMEHGILLIPVNATANNGDANINIHNVLPENPQVVSDTYGSLWHDSIIKTDNGVYGVDTVAKKIWRYGQKGLELLSENRILQFLNQNIVLKEDEKNVILGRRNVKTIYNAFKRDVMFTFYNISGIDEVAWNICFNEKLDEFITFYSWIPSFMENIDNIPFSFNRESSREIQLIYQDANNIQVENPVLLIATRKFVIKGETKELECYSAGLLSVKEYKDYICTYDILSNLNLFQIIDNTITVTENGEIKSKTVQELITKPISEFTDKDKELLEHLVTVDIKVTIKNNKSDLTLGTSTLKLLLATPEYYNKINVSFWKHGQAGIIDKTDSIKPTNWYGTLHPFEYEFVVRDHPEVHKIFDNLEIISNKVAPDSFHYEIVGDAYDFSKYKKNMYIRLEVTKDFYLQLGSDISYDESYKEMAPTVLKEVTPEVYEKSTILPLYYSRLDKLNSIEDTYNSKVSDSKDYSALAGGEITYDKTLEEFRIWNHAKAVDITNKGRLRGNMHYKEDKWDIQINPLTIVQHNEKILDWIVKEIEEGEEQKKKTYIMPPIEIGLNPIPGDIVDKVNSKSYKDIKNNIISWNWGENNISESKLKDKWIKIRVRYTGDKLAIITAIRTLYTISYA